MSLAEIKKQGAAEALAELEQISPGAPFLALGQTVFWDEPMKAGVLLQSQRLGYSRRLVAGVHDTDYFAKLPSGPRQPGKFITLPHNDTTTRGLWSAAGEFSALFGSETVVTRETLAQTGLRADLLQAARPGFLDHATEAWGWRGIVSLDEHPPVTADVPLRQVLHELLYAFDWALDTTLESLAGQGRETARKLAEQLRTVLCDQSAVDDQQTLAAFYERILVDFYRFCSNSNVDLQTTRTTELLRFNRETAGLNRFSLVDLFVNVESRRAAKDAYDEAIQGSGLYGLDRFGTGTIPFDLVIPGHGRGTIRLGTRGAVIMTGTPQFLSFKKPLTSIHELAAAVEAKYGPDCVLVGKAVSLIGMLASEFVFVFHEGASSYVKHSTKFHQLLAERLNWHMPLNPILRVRYGAWDALQVCCSWLRLPEPFQRAFGTEELCAPSFASRWKQVSEEQEELLARISQLHRPIDLIGYLSQTEGGSWQRLAEDYKGLRVSLDGLREALNKIREERWALYDSLRKAKRARVDAERRSGIHFREVIFDKQPTSENLAERQRLRDEIQAIVHAIELSKNRLRELARTQRDLVQDDEIVRIHERRRTIELEAELKRLRLVRRAVITSRGLHRANYRPSAWWFRLVCPDGLWFRETVNSAEYYLEPLI